MEYQNVDYLALSIAQQKEKVMKNVFMQLLNRDILASDMQDFEKYIIKGSNEEWYSYKGKIFGCLTNVLERVCKIKFEFQWKKNPFLDDQIAKNKQLKEEAELKVKQKQNKLWEVVYEVIVPIINGNDYDHKPSAIVNRLRELGFKLEMTKD